MKGIPKVGPKKKKVIVKQPYSNEPTQVDDFFFYALENELPKGKVDDIVMKNLAVWLFQRGEDLGRIESIYKEKGWQFSWLQGWLKKVEAGEIKEVYVGELRNWCRKYLPEKELDLFGASGYLDFSPRRLTEHLPHFSHYIKLFRLKGEEYLPAIKNLYYQEISSILPETNWIIKLGRDIVTDSRLSILIMLMSGKSKKMIS